MKITVSKQDLKEALTLASATLGKGSDITAHFLFEVKEDKSVSILSTDPPRLFSSIPLLGTQVEGDATRFTVEGKRLLKAINSVEGVLTLSFDDGETTLSSKKGSILLSSLDPDYFPPWSDMLKESVDSNTIVSTEIIHDCLHNLKPYCSDKEDRQPELCMVLFKGGMAFGCDGFSLAMAKNDRLAGLELKIHVKDISALTKFLKANEGNNLKLLQHSKASFLQGEDGAVIGFISIEFDMPTKITTQYKDAFDWIPRRVWRFKKQEVLNAISFLSSGADEADHKITLVDPESESFSSPRFEMRPLSAKGTLNYSLESISYDPNSEVEPADLAETMWVERAKITEEEDADIEEFSFNGLFMKRALDVLNSEDIIFGCNQESEKRGYIVFKSKTTNGVDIASVVGWVV